MASWVQVEERLLSGKGILRVPQTSYPFRQAILYADMVRPPRQRYQNVEWNPNRGLLARITYCRDDYVLSADSIEFPRELRETVADIAGQTLIGVKCAYDGTLTSFERLSAALGLIVLPREDLIKDYTNLRLGWDEVRVACYKDTALRLQLWVLPYDVCTSDRDDDQPPPTPPPPPTPVAAGTPIGNISKPYDDDDNDGGNSAPFSGDNFDPEVPLPGELCVRYRLRVRFTKRPEDGGGTDTVTRVLYGPVSEVRFDPTSSNAVQAVCRGYAERPTNDEGCRNSNVVRTLRAGPVLESVPFVIESFTREP